MHHLHILIRQFLSQIWKHTDRPFQDALHIGNGDAVVSDRHILINSTFHPIADLALIQHTASAMRSSLKECVAQEEYEKAAELRDKIRQLEHELMETEGGESDGRQ